MAILDVLAERRRSGSRPGRRTDGARVALVIEGGSSRAAYASGMTVALEQLGLLECFDDVYGSSAGAIAGAFLVAGQAEFSIQGWTHPTLMRTFINPRRALRGAPVVDLDFLLNRAYVDLVPLDTAAVLAAPVRLHPVATDGASGQPVDLAPYLRDDLTVRTALRASACMPVLAGPPVHFEGRTWVDAGVSENIPFRTARAGGATHQVVLRTRRHGEVVPPPSRMEVRVAGRFLSRQAPGAVAPWLGRAAARVGEEADLASQPHTLQIRPPHDAPRVSRTARDPGLLRQAVELGRQAAQQALGAAVPGRSTPR